MRKKIWCGLALALVVFGVAVSVQEARAERDAEAWAAATR